jgi:hypothetical protein
MALRDAQAKLRAADVAAMGAVKVRSMVDLAYCVCMLGWILSHTAGT